MLSADGKKKHHENIFQYASSYSVCVSVRLLENDNAIMYLSNIYQLFEKPFCAHKTVQKLVAIIFRYYQALLN